MIYVAVDERAHVHECGLLWTNERMERRSRSGAGDCRSRSAVVLTLTLLRASE